MMMVTLQTNLGDIDIELDMENTPKTAANFIRYIKAGFYEGTIFHRVIDGFMIQGGGYEVNMQRKNSATAIDNEAEFAQSNLRGTIAMARTSQPHSATSQFFINVSDNVFLDFKNKSPTGWGYCVFGRVVQGMEVVEKIKAMPTGMRDGHQNVPLENIVIHKALVHAKQAIAV